MRWTRSKLFNLDLRRQDGHFIVIEQGKEWNLSQVFRPYKSSFHLNLIFELLCPVRPAFWHT